MSPAELNAIERGTPMPDLPYVIVRREPTKAMATAAASTHYGKRRVEKSGGVRGIAMTVNHTDYNFEQAFKRFWKGAISVSPSPISLEGIVEVLTNCASLLTTLSGHDDPSG
jgi:hypothetical protein